MGSCGRVLLLLWAVLPAVRAIQHWVVTEDGNIQNPADTLQTIRRPHDVVAFMRQEDRLKEYRDIQSHIDVRKSSISEGEKRDDPQLEEKLMATDPDCRAAGKPLSQHSLHSHFLLEYKDVGVKLDDEIGPFVDFPQAVIRAPSCTAALPLDFSPYAFEHVPSMTRDRRSNLSMGSIREEFSENIVHSNWDTPEEFGHAVHLAMQKRPRSWALHNLATLYHRIVGDAVEAVECCRRALHLTPRASLHWPLLNLASVLHQSSFSRDAAVVAGVLTELFPSVPAGWCLFGESLAVSQQLNRSADAFAQCARRANKEVAGPARAHEAAVKCHMKLEAALEAQHEALQSQLSELEGYQAEVKRFTTLHEAVMKATSDPEDKLQAILHYDYFTYGTLPGVECGYETDNGLGTLHCETRDMEQYKVSKVKAMAAFRSKTAPPKPTKTERKDHPASLEQPRNVRIDFDAEKAYLEALEKRRGFQMDKPTRARKYPLVDVSHLDASDYAWRHPSWPAEAECPRQSAVLSRYAVTSPHVFISPEERGWEIGRLLSTEIKLGAGEEHPLPWYPPFCHSLPDHPALHLPCCDHLLGVQKAKNRNKERLMPEAELTGQLLSLSAYPSEQEAEIGQRILTLIKFNMGPRWISLNLAALYWRVVGLVSEGVACARTALHHSPHKSVRTWALGGSR